MSNDGWIAGVISARYTSNTQILINNIAIGGIIGINNQTEGTGGCFAKVNKGDEVKVIVGSSGSTNVEIKFIPHK